jgi:myosin heavy subunit
MRAFLVILACMAVSAQATRTQLRRRAPEEKKSPAAYAENLDSMITEMKGKAKAAAETDASEALKFQQVASGQAEGSGSFAAKVYKVGPAVTDGMAVKPAPGQNDPIVHIRPRSDYTEDVKISADYLGSHSYKDDIKALLQEVDRSENIVKGLKLRVVEKENFIDSLVKREDLLQEDVNRDKQATENLHAHIKALRARIERLKKTKQLTQLKAQYNEYVLAATKLHDQTDELDKVKGALENKINSIQAATQPLLAKEEKEMRDSIDASGSQIAKIDAKSAGAFELNHNDAAMKAARDSAHNAADSASQAEANPKATPPSPESSAGGGLSKPDGKSTINTQIESPPPPPETPPETPSDTSDEGGSEAK